MLRLVPASSACLAAAMAPVAISSAPGHRRLFSAHLSADRRRLSSDHIVDFGSSSLSACFDVSPAVILGQGRGVTVAEGWQQGLRLMRGGDGAGLGAKSLSVPFPCGPDGVGAALGRGCCRVLRGYEASETLVGFRAAVSAERVTKAASSFVPCDGELSSEADESILWHCSNLSTAEYGMRSSLPPRRKAGRAPVEIRLRTVRSEHCQRRAKSAGRNAWTELSTASRRLMPRPASRLLTNRVP